MISGKRVVNVKQNARWILARFLSALLFCDFFSAAAFAAPPPADYVATVPCKGQPTLTPPDNIIRVKGEQGAKVFELKPAAGVTLTVKGWKIEGDSPAGNAVTDWGQLQFLNDNKTMRWTLGANAQGSFKISATIRRSCGKGGPNGGLGEDKDEDEDIELWSGSALGVTFESDPIITGFTMKAGDPTVTQVTFVTVELHEEADKIALAVGTGDGLVNRVSIKNYYSQQ